MQLAKSVRREKTDKQTDRQTDRKKERQKNRQAEKQAAKQTKETEPRMIMHEILCLDIGKPPCKERQTKETDRNGGSGGWGGGGDLLCL